MSSLPEVLLLTHRSSRAHDPGDGHPDRPARLRAVLGALESQRFAALHRATAPAATQEQLLRVHTPAYLSFLESAALPSIASETRPAEAGPASDTPPPPARLVVAEDTSIGEGSWQAALHAAGAGIAAVDAVCGGVVQRAFCAVRPPGHHAEPDRAMGFCLLSNAALAACHAQAAWGVPRVAILDFDAHYGNGSHAVAAAHPGLFYASSHQEGLFPSPESSAWLGGGNSAHAALRGLPAGAGGAEFRTAWEDLLTRVEDFQPGLLVLSAGFDAHRRDPMAELLVETDDFLWLSEEICRLARRCCAGRVVSMLEGGYDIQALASGVSAHVSALLES